MQNEAVERPLEEVCVVVVCVVNSRLLICSNVLEAVVLQTNFQASKPDKFKFLS